MKRKFLEAETKDSSRRGRYKERERRKGGKESDVILQAARESHMLAARQN